MNNAINRTELFNKLSRVPLSQYAVDERTQIYTIINEMETETVFTLGEVAEILATAFGDECACNFNGNDEWLPQVCKYSETTCPDPAMPHGCWRQYLLQGGGQQ